jgi:hypothetical protein
VSIVASLSGGIRRASRQDLGKRLGEFTPRVLVKRIRGVEAGGGDDGSYLLVFGIPDPQFVIPGYYYTSGPAKISHKQQSRWALMCGLAHFFIYIFCSNFRKINGRTKNFEC